MRGRVNAIRTFKGLVADLRVNKTYSYNAKFLSNGIDSIEKTAQQDLLPIYNLRGVKVGTGWKALQRLPKSIYIIGGKKVTRLVLSISFVRF